MLTKTQFRNRTGRLFEIRIDPTVIDLVRNELHIDLYSLESLRQIPTDLFSTCNLLWHTCGRPGTLESFTRDMTMQSCLDGQSAFIEAICEFLPSSLSVPIRLAHAKLNQIADQTYSAAERAVAGLFEPAA